MVNSVKTLFQDVVRAPVAALLIFLGLCASLAPLTGLGHTVRPPDGPSGFVRVAASPSHAQASERLLLATKGSFGERGHSLVPSPPFLVTGAITLFATPLFGGAPILGLPQFSASLYHARAPPAA